MRKILSLLVILPAATSAFAHEGHGHTHGFTVTHYFTEPEHVIPLVLVIAGLILLVRKYRKSPVKK